MSNKFSRLELDLFVEHTCSRCFQTDEAHARCYGEPGEHGCPHLKRAYVRDQMPGVWTRRRNGALGETFNCGDFTAKPPSTRRGRAEEETEPLFGIELAPGVKTLVPVEGWPDFRAEARKQADGDHQ